jgi:hypothetical protein
MKKQIARFVLAVVLFGVVGAAASVTIATAQGRNCEARCQADYRQCVPFCSRNPCFVACETLLEICLSNCAATS